MTYYWVVISTVKEFKEEREELGVMVVKDDLLTPGLWKSAIALRIKFRGLGEDVSVGGK